jgi:hypothetical protein
MWSAINVVASEILAWLPMVTIGLQLGSALIKFCRTVRATRSPSRRSTTKRRDPKRPPAATSQQGLTQGPCSITMPTGSATLTVTDHGLRRQCPSRDDHEIRPESVQHDDTPVGLTPMTYVPSK